MAVKEDKQTRAASQARVRMFIQMARKYGLSELKVGEIEIKLGAVSQLKPTIDNEPKAIETKTDSVEQVDPMPSDEEMLVWSTPNFDELQSSK